MQHNQTGQDLWCQEIFGIIIFSIFGGLFYSFTNEPSKHDSCKQPQFLDWTLLTSYVCFAIIAMYSARILLRICNLTQQLAIYWMVLDYITSLGVLICSIGLAVKNTDACGDLSTLAMVFYILVFIGIGCGILGICCCCCIGGGMVAAGLVANNDLEKMPINRQEEQNGLVANHSVTTSAAEESQL